MDIHMDRKGAEYAHCTDMAVWNFQPETWLEAVIRRADMDTLWYDMHRIEPTGEKTWKYLTAELWRIK